jgi:uncharacterized protein (DUF2267 family)
MDENAFLERVRTGAGLDSPTAARDAADAVLGALADHLGERQAEELADALPGDVGDALLDDAGPAESFDLGEFLARVADRAGVGESAVLTLSRAVFAATEAAAGGELADAREQLSRDFDLAFEAGTPMTGNEFVAAVGRRAGLTGDDARPAAEAVLHTLGERVSRGEAEDLATYLPDALARALLAGSRRNPPDFGRDEFLARVAGRAGGSRPDARAHAATVFDVLGEVAGERAVGDVRSQLPAAFDPLFEAREAVTRRSRSRSIPRR